MKKLIYFLATLLVCVQPAFADKYIAKGNDTAIISNVCLYDSTDGINKITNVDSEDAGLKITLTSSDHATLQVYDVTGEIEPITTFGTWLAPTALNVRFEADPTTGCYEFQFLANSFENGVTANLAIEDTSSPTFMDRDIDIQIWAKAFFDLMDGTTGVLTARNAGNPLDTTFASVTNQLVAVLTAGAPNDDAYRFGTAQIIGDSVGEECFADITDYDQASKAITFRGKFNALADACPFTMAATDRILIHAWGAGAAADTIETDVGNAQSDLTSVKAKTDQLVFTVANELNVNALSISGDSTAANNLELQYDTTGLTGNTFPATQLAVATVQIDLTLLNSTFLNCEVNTANFAGSTSTFACILTDLGAGAVTQASNDLEGLQIVVTSGAQIREARFINDTTWDVANSELQMTLSRALPATLADAVTVIVR